MSKKTSFLLLGASCIAIFVMSLRIQLEHLPNCEKGIVNIQVLIHFKGVPLCSYLQKAQRVSCLQ